MTRTHESRLRGERRQWRPSLLSWAIMVLAVGGLAVALYPMTASWLTSYNQSKVLERAIDDLETLQPGRLEQLASARLYNAALTAGVELEPGGNVPVGTGNLAGEMLRYSEQLTAGRDGLMARIKIPGIRVDLPVYHGTGDAALSQGAGHLEGSHLPVGGEGTRAVVTAHRGLAHATMFSRLNRVALGDRFTIDVMGEALTYEVDEVRVIEPAATSVLRAEPGRDLVTLITCTPLGINSHRIVVTGERVVPTPEEDLAATGEPPGVPGFPWWGLLGVVGVALIAGYGARQGRIDAAAATREDAPRGGRGRHAFRKK